MSSYLIKIFVENSFSNRNCSIQSSALDYFVETWDNLYGYDKLNTLDEYVAILFREYAFGNEGYEFTNLDIEDLNDNYITPEHIVWNELKDQPELVEQLKAEADAEDVDFVTEEKYESWLRLNL